MREKEAVGLRRLGPEDNEGFSPTELADFVRVDAGELLQARRGAGHVDLLTEDNP